MKTQGKQDTQVILNSAIGQRLLSVPEDGLLVRLKIDGQRLVAEFEEGDRRDGSALQVITWALEKLRVDQIDDPNDVFAPYNPGKFRGPILQGPQALDTEAGQPPTPQPVLVE